MTNIFQIFQFDSIIVCTFEMCIVYCSYQMMSQFSAMSFVGYMLFLMIFLGLVMMFFDLDMFALFLWMVYGGLMASIIIFLLAWGNADARLTKLQVSKGFLWGSFMVIFGFLFLVLNSFQNFCISTTSKLVLEMKYFSECLMQDITLELEVLGWGLIILSSVVFMFIGMLLSFVCFVTVKAVMISSQLKWVSAGCLAFLNSEKQKLKSFVTLSTQNFFKQEWGMMGISRSIMKLKHNHIY